jgi:hypothetical protein
MTKRIGFSFVVALALLRCSAGYSATLVWTNTAGGNWSDSASWSPNQVPGVSDDAVVTNSGSYSVTLDTNPVVIASLTLGGSGGQQSLATAGNNLTLNNASQVETNGVLQLEGDGVLGGAGPLAVKGQLDWTGGRIDVNSVLTVATNGLVYLDGDGSFLDFSGVLTNAGTILLTNGGIRCVVYSTYGGGYGLLVNAAGGLIDLRDGSFIGFYNDSSGSGTPAVLNYGTVRKSSGGDTTLIDPRFTNSGTLDAQVGTISVNGGGSGSGVFQAEAGATLAYAADYEVDGTLTGEGTNALTHGTFTLNGRLNTANTVLAGDAVLEGTNGVIAGQLTWNSNGRIGAGSVLTVATNGLVYVDGDGNFLDFSGVLTNAGTILLTNGGIRCVAYSSYGGGYGLLVNAAGGLIDLRDASFFGFYNDGSGSGTPAVLNYGIVRKSSGSDTTAIKPPFYNSGTLDAQTGTISVNGGGSGSGGFEAEAGATLAFGGDYEVDGTLSGEGTNSFTGGAFALNGRLNTAYAVLAGTAVLGGTNGVIAGQLTWNPSARIGAGSVLTVATNGLVYVDAGGSGGYVEFSGVLTNAGTIVLTNGGIRCLDYSSYGGGYGLLVNAAGGLIDLRDGSLIDFYNDSSGSGTPAVLNYGTVRKSSGSDTTPINPPFTNSGTLDAQSGVIALNGSYDLTGGTLNFGINSLTNFGQIMLGGAAALVGTLSANLNHGYIPVSGNAFGVLSYGSEGGVFTNTNLPLADAWSLTYSPTVLTLNVLNARPTLTAITNQIVNELATLTLTNTAADADVPAQTLTFTFAAAPNGMTLTPLGANAGVISWTPAQTNSPSTNTVSVVVTDNGTPPLSATNTFMVIVREVNLPPSLSNISTQFVNELTRLTVINAAGEPNIHSTTTGYGLINPPQGMILSPGGVITWTPGQNQSPSTNLVTTVVTNSNPYDLANPHLSATNTFTVIVKEVNVAPVLPVIGTQTVTELGSLMVTNTATESNIHSTLGYALANPPAGMSIDPNGIISWKPQQNQSPSTNLITTVVTNSNPYDLVNPHLGATNTFTVIVREANVAPVLPAIPTLTVSEQALLTVTNTASETNIHATLGYQLVNPPAGMTISTNGIITWTPPGPTTNLVTTVATSSDAYDLNNPHLSATNSFLVQVVPLPELEIVRVGGQPHLTWGVVPGWRYQVWHKEALPSPSWTTLGDPLTASGDTLEFTDSTTTGINARFYRVQVLGPP